MDRKDLPPVGGRTREGPWFRSLGIAASGLSAQRARIEVMASNIANASATHTPAGGAYRRRVVELREVPFEGVLQNSVAPRREDEPVVGVRSEGFGGGVEVVGVVEDPTPGPRIYDPGHPHAGPDGYVELSNVDITQELVGLLEARRLYEANASVFEAVKSMLRRATQL